MCKLIFMSAKMNYIWDRRPCIPFSFHQIIRSALQIPFLPLHNPNAILLFKCHENVWNILAFKKQIVAEINKSTSHFYENYFYHVVEKWNILSLKHHLTWPKIWSKGPQSNRQWHMSWYNNASIYCSLFFKSA